jgi:hypothetical protein
MGQARFISRKDLLNKILESSGLTPEDVEQEREQLASLAPAMLLRHWFGAADPNESPSPAAKKLREVVRKRSSLFEWVYGRDNPVARDLMYVRLPSGEKRRLVSLLVLTARPRLPWLDSRTLHAMAFRPSAFGAKSKGLSHVDTVPWGELYRRMGIPKGSGKRFLTIPNPALMQVHRSLLQIIGPGLERSLDRNVFGATRGVSGPTFQNAALHRDGEYVASFDLKDFFPSVRVGDIVRGIQLVAKQGIPMVDPAALAHLPSDSTQRRELRWTNDAMLLVARLCTHRSRLPQGAPLSPLLASVAFSRFDRRIVRRLLAEFGPRNFQYTRYFDDITVSLRRTAALRCGIKGSPEALRKIEKCLADALEGSSFALNRSKSRCTRLRPARVGDKSAGAGSAAEVTGLLLRTGEVSLPRATKRWIRETVHRLGRQSFVEAAKDWSTADGRQAPEWQSSRLGHRWRQTLNFRRRCSAERLAVLMLGRSNPDLRIRLIHKDWYAWQARLQDGAEVRVGRAARDPLQALLAAHWRGQTTVRRTTPTEVVFSHDDVDVCAVSSESDLAYLWLPTEDAIRVADYWHHLHGMLAYLRGCPAGHEFEEVHAWKDRLAAALRQTHLGQVASLSSEERGTSEDGFVWFVDEALGGAAGVAFNRYCDFAKNLGVQPSGAWSRLQGEFSRRVQDEQGFHDWLCAVSQLTVRTLPRLPPSDLCSRGFPGESFFDYVRLREDNALGRIGPDYRVIDQVEEALGLGDERVPVSSRFVRAQLMLLERLGKTFAIQSEGQSRLRQNRWVVSLAERVRASVDRLAELLPELRSTSAERRLLDRDSGVEFYKARDLLVASGDSATSEESWRHLFKVAKVLCMTTREVLEPGLCAEEVSSNADGPHPDQVRRDRVWKELLKLVPADEARLKVLPWLRNRDSHPETPEQRAAWVSLQRKISEFLGRKWKPTTGKDAGRFRAPDDLGLTGYEGNLLKAEMFESLRAALEAALASRVWEHWGRSGLR